VSHWRPAVLCFFMINFLESLVILVIVLGSQIITVVQSLTPALKYYFKILS
jgi:hypothetical protein